MYMGDARCLSTLDITLLGIGHMMGSGIYVLTPSVARQTAGESTILICWAFFERKHVCNVS